MYKSAISRAARSAVIARLADPTSGFNPNLQAALADAGIVDLPPGWVLPIDFSATSKNFFAADVEPDALDETSTVTYPVITIFGLNAVNKNKEKFRMFAGDCALGLNVFASWKAGRVLPDFETLMDCVEEAIFVTLNTTDRTLSAWAVNDVLAYNGDLLLNRTKLDKGAEHWRQALIGKLTMDVSAIG